MLTTLMFPRQASCAVTAFDRADQSAYGADATGAWKGLNPTTGENPPGSDNGGVGFNPWNFVGGFHQPEYSPYGTLNHFVDGVDFVHSDFNNLGGTGFGLTNSNVAPSECTSPIDCPFGGETTRATRSFAAPMQPGDSFSFEFDNPAALTRAVDWSPAGILFRLNAGSGPVGSGGVERVGMFAVTGVYGEPGQDSHWHLSDAADVEGTPINTAVALATTSTGTRFEFTLATAETYVLNLLRISDGSTLFSGSGRLKNTDAGAINTIEIAIFGNGGGNGGYGQTGAATGQRELFFDHFLIESPSADLIGDYNGDSNVDAADYVLWRKTLGQFVSEGEGADGNGSGQVDPLDFDVWRINFGNPQSSAGAAAVAISEPAAIISLLTAFGLYFAIPTIRRRRGAVY